MRERRLKATDPEKPRIQVRARKEIVIAGGALHSPQVLQRSGIGPKALLEKAKIPVLVDLPGVGSNLQDHAVSGISYKYNTNVLPNPEDSNANATFVAWATEEWMLRRQGPRSQATGNVGGEVPLPVIDPVGYNTTINFYKSLDIAKYLPAVYTTEQVAGYEKMRVVLADMMGRPDNAWLELPLQGSGQFAMVLIKGLSRGTVLIDPADIYADPIVDYHTYFIPADLEMMVKIVKFVRRFHQTPSMLKLGPVETKPGPNVTSDDDIRAYLRGASSCSTAHNSGSNAMLPRELGGVVSSDLLVYGVTGLSVADSSIMPILIVSHIRDAPQTFEGS
jgi:choline dehydrogenase-like flavoprotein